MTLELNTIHTGDAKELATAIPDESVSLVFTDPVYENLTDYEWLGHTAMRVLKDNSALLVFVSTNRLFDCKAILEASGLVYRWVLYYATPASQKTLHLYGIFNCVTPCLIFNKGRTKASPYLPDFYETRERAENGFAWQKNSAVLRKWLTAFSKKDEIVFDPFAGTGSLPAACKNTGRQFIAFELDGERARKANQRVAATPIYTPMFTEEIGKQIGLGL